MLAHMYTYIDMYVCAAGTVCRSDSKILAKWLLLSYNQFLSGCSGQKSSLGCMFDLFKRSINQIKSVQQIRQHVLTVYCPNMYTVWQAHSRLREGCCPKLLILILKLWQEFYPRARNRLWISAYYIHSSRYDWQNWYKSISKENSCLNKFLSSALSMSLNNFND